MQDAGLKHSGMKGLNDEIAAVLCVW